MELLDPMGFSRKVLDLNPKKIPEIKNPNAEYHKIEVILKIFPKIGIFSLKGIFHNQIISDLVNFPS